MRVRTSPVLLMAIQRMSFKDVPNGTKFQKFNAYGELGPYIFLKIPTSENNPLFNYVTFQEGTHVNGGVMDGFIEVAAHMKD